MASYDVESVRMRRMVDAFPAGFRIGASLEARRAKTFERHNLALYDGIIAVSELDKKIFEQQYEFDPERVLAIENGVDPLYFQFTERVELQDPHIVLVGNFGYLPNRQAALRLVREIMPLVRRQWPQARCWLVGSGADQALRNSIVDARDVVTGQVADVRPYLAMASVACIPLLAGSGTKYKVLEAMSAGAPVVCTPLAAEGLHLEDKQHVLLGASNDEIAEAVTQLLGDTERSAALAKRARGNIETRYSWDANLGRLEAWLEQVRELPRRAQDRRRRTEPGG
jgi:glycosyltransferase involved in cell wall biosynthesis